ncbi:DPP IV N-terminal domain-containing protein [Isosphaera pallida]|nr:DPP IV N-terminal domain-containing protein [Isosphaera pallida]
MSYSAMVPLRAWQFIALTFVLSLAGWPFAASADAPASLPTIAERSNYQETATYEQVVDHLRQLAQRHPDVIRLGDYGRSFQGRPLPHLILAQPPIDTPEAVANSGKLVVLATGAIHAGEVCGKEALPALVRDLAETHSPLLNDLVFIVAPILNPDGNDAFGPIEQNRPGQHGPARVGTRENAQRLDLNRDWMKLETPELRGLVDLMNRCQPHVVIETHTTNGSAIRHTMTYDGSKHPAASPALRDYLRNDLLPGAGADLERATGFTSTFYGYFDRAGERWLSYPGHARYGTNYQGLRGCVSVLTEAYSHAPYKDRVIATREYVRAILERVARDRDQVHALCQQARRESQGQVGDPIAIRERIKPVSQPLVVQGYERHSDQNAPKDYTVSWMNDIVADETVPRPFAYLLPPEASQAVATLERHGLTVQTLSEPIELELEVDRIDALEHSERTFQNHRLLTVGTTRRTLSRVVPAGWRVVPATQPLGTLAVLLLEPRSDDGLTAWNAFDDLLEVGGDHPVARLATAPTRPLPITPIAVTPPAELASPRSGPNVSTLQEQDPPKAVRREPDPGPWLDADHWLTPDRRNKVHARTGEITPLDGPLPELPVANRLRGELGGVAVPGYVSPDGQWRVQVSNLNLTITHTTTKETRQLTHDGGGPIRNGDASYVYWEEVFDRDSKAFWWSPDSRHLAFIRFDETPVPPLPVLDAISFTPSPRPAYPRVGEPNPPVKLGIVAIDQEDGQQASPVFFDPPDNPDGSHLIVRAYWRPDGQEVYAYVLDRNQTWLDVYAINLKGEARKLFRETTGAWVETWEAPIHLKDGSFLFLSERDGYRHLYRYSRDGALLGQVTRGDWAIHRLLRVDEENDRILFTSRKDEPVGMALYSTRMDGSNLKRLTPGPGVHLVSLAPEGPLFLDRVSTHTTPTTITLRSVEDGLAIRTINTDTSTSSDSANPGGSKVELVAIPTADGDTIYAEIITPADLDESMVYPVYLSVYGGPRFPAVSDSWKGGRVRDQALNAQGYIVFRVDPRSASDISAKSAWLAYKRLGVTELHDLETALEWLKNERPYCDTSRVGIVGASYGGFMAAFALTHSDKFAAGVADAAVTDWRDYDTIYTERYMLTPKENPKGYQETSVVEAATKLKGKLLIVHGGRDFNVPVQNAFKLAHALQRANLEFEFMIYPTAGHGGFGAHAVKLSRDFLKRALGDPRPRADAEDQADR